MEMLCVWDSFEKLFVIIVPFVDLQGFIFERKFVVKKMAVLRKRNVLSHYIFVYCLPCNLFTKFDKSCASWLIANHHGLDDGMVQHGDTSDYIAVVGTEDDDVLLYFKRYVKNENGWRTCLKAMREITIIEILDANYKNIESLNNLDVINTTQCKKHVKNCTLQNVFKIFNWLNNAKKNFFIKKIYC